MKVTVLIMVVAGMLSACSVRPAPQAGQTLDETAQFCEAVVDYVINQYGTLPQRIRQTTYQIDDAAITKVRVVDMQHVRSDYDVILQHQGRHAVYDYCLARHHQSRLESNV